MVDATSYDLWINYDGVPAKSQIVREQNLLSTNYTVSATLPKGKYSVWVRAKRAEAGSVYESLWSQRLLLELSRVHWCWRCRR
ncbi:MAG: hypothetical protein ACMG6S_29490, partial [Byssovorax sp.]